MLGKPEDGAGGIITFNREFHEILYCCKSANKIARNTGKIKAIVGGLGAGSYKYAAPVVLKMVDSTLCCKDIAPPALADGWLRDCGIYGEAPLGAASL
jgi:hypothetical protein